MHQVAAIQIQNPYYPQVPPYHPSQHYPEYPFEAVMDGEENQVYAGVRQLFVQLGLDLEHYNTPQWNPLGYLIQPGMTVVMKPNFVLSNHKLGKDLFSIITHPSLLRAIADYVWIALKGKGQIIFADAPQYDCNFTELLQVTHLDGVVQFYLSESGPKVEIRDLRKYWSRWKHFDSLLEPLPGDPQGSLTVNLAHHSAISTIAEPHKLYGAVYHREETIDHHTGFVQEYEVSKTIMEADVVISVPKLKVHKKVGVTLNAKGLVGICTNKNYLVHYRVTPPSQGGDQYPDGLLNPMEQWLIRTERWMYDHLLASRNPFLERLHRTIYALHNATTRRLGIKVDEQKRQLDAGNWHGNDSAWRMTVDLMKVFHFADPQGTMQRSQQRRTFSIIDGIIGGDNNGPLVPDPVHSRTLIGGENFLAVDIVATRLMGFDPRKVRVYDYLLTDDMGNFGISSYKDIQVLSPNAAWITCLDDRTSEFLGFKPHLGWIGHLEMITI